MRKTKEEAAVTRRNLLDAALTVFSQNGYAATTLEDVAKEAGVTRGAIYWHFGSKAELYTALITEMNAGTTRTIEDAVAEGGSFLEVLHRIFVRLLEDVEKDEKVRAVSELVLFKTAIVPELEEGMMQKRAGVAQSLQMVEDAVSEGIKSGEIRADINPRDAALALLSIQQGMLTAWLLTPDLFSLKEHAAPVLDIVFAGLRAT